MTQNNDVRPGGRGFPGAEVYRGIKLLILDVDGTLTNGVIAFDAAGLETKHFHVHDGTGLTMLRSLGVQLALISGRHSPVTEKRAQDLKIPAEMVHQGAHRKIPVYERLLKMCNLTDEAVCFVGDDLIDLPVLERVGIAACPADARPEMPPACHAVASLEGGRGAVRQICEHLLRMREDGSWQKAVDRYLDREGA